MSTRLVIMKIAVVEDDQQYMDMTLSYLKQYSEEKNVDYQIDTFSDGLTFVEKYNKYDLIFLDIKMPLYSGIELAKDIRKIDENVLIIFLTSFSQFAIKGYEVNAFDYIVKPVEYSVFKIKFDRAIECISKKNNVVIEVVSNYETYVINIDDILYIESEGHKLIFHLFSKDINSWGKISDFEDKLSQYGFTRCNNCYLVNLKYVENVKKSNVIVKGIELKISRNRLQSFADRLTLYLNKGE